MEAVFQWSGLLVMPVWLLMIVLPHWRWTRQLLTSPLAIAPAALLYAALVVPRIAEIWPMVSNASLPAVMNLLGTPAGATIGWVHFLAFDLFVGRWAYLDSRQRNISAWLMAPVLFMTIMLGPVGFLLYLVVRAVATLRSVDVTQVDVPTQSTERSFPVSTGNQHYMLAQRLDPRPFLRKAWTGQPFLTFTGLATIGVLLVSLAGIAVDPRVITGEAAWIKPAKFGLSVAIYVFTLIWLLQFIEGHRRRRIANFVANVTAVGFVVEFVAIITQVVRGVRSHFNVATAFDAAMYSLMGGFVVLIWIAALVAAVLLTLQKLPDRAFAWSLRLGILIAVVGMGLAFFMTTPTRVDQASIEAGIVGAHSVGVADGGAGLPIVGWSTLGGDLRVAHFVGLHSLQVLPLVGWLVSRKRVKALLSAGHRVVLVVSAGLGYGGLTVLLAWQAFRGQSVIAPDGLTLTAAFALIAVVGLSLMATLAHARVRTPVAQPMAA